MSTAQLPALELDNADKIWHLQQGILTENLSLQELHMLSSICEDVVYPKETVIFRQDDPAENFFFLNRGTVREMVSTLKGREKILSVLGAGDVFGEDALERESLRKSQAIAHEETWVSQIGRRALLDLLKQIPALNLNFSRALQRKLGEAQSEIETLSFGDTEFRIARTLLKLSRTHGRSLASQETVSKIKFLISHEHLAQLIGANRPHVSSIMSKFKKRGLVDYQKRKLVVDVGRMTEVVAAEAKQ